jgi:phosphatidate cytidylyltransferase
MPSDALRQRLLTAGLLVPLIIGGILLLPTPLFALLMAGIVLLAAWEWAPLAGLVGVRARSAVVAAGAAGLLCYGCIRHRPP